MGELYTETGYVDPEYTEGDDVGIASGITGKVPIDFFISSGVLEESELIASIQNTLNGEDRFGLLQVPESGKLILVSKNGFVSFLGQSEALESRLTQLEEAVANIAENTIDMSVAMKAPDGTIIASPDVIKDGTSFTFVVPEEAAGALYSVTVDVDMCDGCGS